MKNSEIYKIKVCIADKHFIHRLGVKTILSVIGIEPDLYEADDFTSTMSCIRDVDELKFVVVAQDVLGPDMNRSILKLKAIKQEVKLLVVCDDFCNCKAKALYILEDNTRQQVLEKFQSFFYDNNDENAENNSDLLSEREIDVLKTVALGYSNKEIAEKLFISINTVISHRKNITEKLGIKTIAGLTVYAVMHDLIKPEEVKG